MKNLPLILSAGSLAGVIVLFVLFFVSKPETEPGGIKTGVSIPVKTNLDSALMEKIAYVNTDSVLSKYYFYIDESARLEKEGEKMQNELLYLQNQLQKKYEEFQNKVFLRESLKVKAQEELLKQQQTLQIKNEEYNMALMQLQQVFQKQISDSLIGYVKLYNKSHGYTIIFSTAYGGSILDAEGDMDITGDIIVGMNERYDKAMEIVDAETE